MIQPVNDDGGKDIDQEKGDNHLNIDALIGKTYQLESFADHERHAAADKIIKQGVLACPLHQSDLWHPAEYDQEHHDAQASVDEQQGE